MTYVAPKFKGSAFNCPHCGAFAHQRWVEVWVSRKDAHIPKQWPKGARGMENFVDYPALLASVCNHCHKEIVWFDGKVLYPDYSGVPQPNLDLSDDIRNDYQEAANIVQRSPRGAAALLRLCVQKLCKQLGKPGKDINQDIGALVKEGLPVEVQQALDIVRVTGNEAVHPGALDLRDDLETAQSLFGLLNLIANNRITQPKQIQEMFDALPESKKQGIAQRDGTS